MLTRREFLKIAGLLSVQPFLKYSKSVNKEEFFNSIKIESADYLEKSLYKINNDGWAVFVKRDSKIEEMIGAVKLDAFNLKKIRLCFHSFNTGNGKRRLHDIKTGKCIDIEIENASLDPLKYYDNLCKSIKAGNFFGDTHDVLYKVDKNNYRIIKSEKLEKDTSVGIRLFPIDKKGKAINIPLYRMIQIDRFDLWLESGIVQRAKVTINNCPDYELKLIKHFKEVKS